MWPKRMNRRRDRQVNMWKHRHTDTTSIERYKDRYLKNTFRKADRRTHS